MTVIFSFPLGEMALTLLYIVLRKNLYNTKDGSHILYFAMYNAHFFAQIFEGKIRMLIIHGYNDYIPGV